MQSWNSWSLSNWTPYQSWNFCCCITKPHVDPIWFNVAHYNYWLFGRHWTLRHPHSLNGMYCRFGPFMMAVKCWNVQCLGLRATLGIFFSLIKENEHFIQCAIINTHWKNFKLAMRVIQIKLQGMHVYLQALNEITAWKSRRVWLTMTVVFRNHN